MPNLPHIAEYGAVLANGWPTSDREILARQYFPGMRREVRLVHIDIGYECAGSMMRYNPTELWAVLHDIDGATHGRRFLSLAEAEAHWTHMLALDAERLAEEIKYRPACLQATIESLTESLTWREQNGTRGKSGKLVGRCAKLAAQYRRHIAAAQAELASLSN